MKRKLASVAFLLVLAALRCGTLMAKTRAEALREKFDSDDRDYVFVCMHRGDWRNAPENSVGAIRGAIEAGADIVEMDVAKTKDGKYVLLHDGRLDRVSNGSGPSTDYTLEEIRKFRLKGPDGRTLTDYGIITLEEAFAITRGNILIDLDKLARDPEGIARFVKDQGMEREVIMMSDFSPKKLRKKLGEEMWSDVVSGRFLYMPIMRLDKGAGLAEFEAWDNLKFKPTIYEVCVRKEDDVPVLDRLKANARSGGPRIWLNTLWDSFCAGHTDERAIRGDPDGGWGWCLENGATVIQSDRPRELMKYLREKGRRNATFPPAKLPSPVGLEDERGASIYHSYEFHPVDDTPPPDGFRPFYISHYGRHGSRRLMEPVAAEMEDALMRAERAAALTDEGAKLLDGIRRLRVEHDGMLGELTIRGSKEHRMLAHRMVERFPAVFEGGGRVECRSSNVPRCLLSMANFSIGLKDAVPEVDVGFTTGEKVVQVIVSLPDGFDDLRRSSREHAISLARECVDAKAFLDRIVADVPARREIVKDATVFAYDVYRCASICQCLSEELGGLSLYGFFTVDERCALSRCLEAEHYGMMGNSAESGAVLVREARGLLRDVVERADAAVSCGVAADLRFGHDAGLWPLAALMGISGAGDCVSVGDVWRMCPVWRFMSMASNLQMVFYRNDGGDVIVKMLYNEQETAIRGMSAKGPYYRWSELRRHFLDAIEKLSAEPFLPTRSPSISHGRSSRSKGHEVKETSLSGKRRDGHRAPFGGGGVDGLAEDVDEVAGIAEPAGGGDFVDCAVALRQHYFGLGDPQT